MGTRYCSNGCLMFVAVGSIAFSLLAAGLQFWVEEKSYLFDGDEIALITTRALERTKGEPPNATLLLVEEELRKTYSSHILSRGHTEWVFMNCGGWMGAMYLLHASVTEYVLFFGTGLDTSGHSGRYWANISDTLVSGTFRQWKEGGMDIREYSVGDIIVHEFGEVTGVQWTSGTLMVEYGRGFLPSTLLYALADTLFSTTDYYHLFKVLKVYSIAMIRELLQGNL